MGASALLLCCGAGAVHAAAISVGTTADDNTVNGNCTLREAVIAANTDAAADTCAAGNGADEITVPAGTYVLTLVGAGEDAAATGDLDVTEDVDIQGAAAASTIIDGYLTDRVFDFDPAASGITAQLAGVTVRNGAQGQGAGIRNGGTLTVADSTVTSNRAVHGEFARGGGIRSSGYLTVMRSRVTDNIAERISGAMFNVFAEGGGIYSDGPATVIATTVDGNSVLASLAFPPGNVAGGGIYADALLTVDASAVTNNTADPASAAAYMDSFGGGIAAIDVNLTNSTISGNRAVGKSFPAPLTRGGGVYAGTAAISNCTFANNQKTLVPDGSLANGVAGGTITLRNTIIADACDHYVFPPTIIGDAYNLDAGNTCEFSGTDLINTNPLLGPLQDNGGPTFSHLLQPLSPAREAGSPAVPGSGGTACEAVDQRGATRPQFARCDIGSVEVGFCPLPLAGCAAPGKSLLLIKDRDGDGAGAKDKLIWKWLKGPPALQTAFGDPTATTEYKLCLYAGTATVLATSIPGGDTCGGVPCWKALGSKGYRRSDPAAGVGGVSKVILKGGEQSKVLIKGKGANLEIDADTLPLTGTVVVQLTNSANANCWQSTFSTSTVNSDTLFKAKAP